ncbi:MAG TPA: WecB/TagA/CpsF family glycosyltransferase [Candidatus Acidoferrales bacterium]|nr:WecB/TagA/CpsF family glycosyltransferase [Candidatus Acidoferrales bacterium]
MIVNSQSAPGNSSNDLVPGSIGQGLGFDDEPASARFKILGVGVSPVQIPQVVSQIEWWIQKRERCRYIAVTGMHGVTEAQHDPRFRHILNSADLVVPDGMPLVWLARTKGHPLRRRVYGPELMDAFCAQSARGGYKHFFYGGAAGVAEKLAAALREKHSGLNIVGVLSPPFRPVTSEEHESLIAQINAAQPDVVWVGLSTPKQERWMFENRDRLDAAVLIGVGAAFDFFAGLKKQAPKWMRESGFEWAFRLLQEPRRLWRRYLVYGSRFVYLVALEELGIRKWE